jgi:hypothetical protein
VAEPIVIDDDPYVVAVGFFDGHGGPGWYYFEAEYEEEGCSGPFKTREEAEAHALTSGERTVFELSRFHDAKLESTNA